MDMNDDGYLELFEFVSLLYFIEKTPKINNYLALEK